MRIVNAFKTSTSPVLISSIFRRHSNYKFQLYRSDKYYIPPDEKYEYGHFIVKEKYLGRFSEDESIPENWYLPLENLPYTPEINQISQYFVYGKPIESHM
jgi:hypothetical protein